VSVISGMERFLRNFGRPLPAVRVRLSLVELFESMWVCPLRASRVRRFGQGGAIVSKGLWWVPTLNRSKCEGGLLINCYIPATLAQSIYDMLVIQSNDTPGGVMKDYSSYRTSGDPHGPCNWANSDKTRPGLFQAIKQKLARAFESDAPNTPVDIFAPHNQPLPTDAELNKQDQSPKWGCIKEEGVVREVRLDRFVDKEGGRSELYRRIHTPDAMNATHIQKEVYSRQVIGGPGPEHKRTLRTLVDAWDLPDAHALPGRAGIGSFEAPSVNRFQALTLGDQVSNGFLIAGG